MSAISSICHIHNQSFSHELGPTLMKELLRYPAHAIDAWQQDGIFLGCHSQWITPESRHEPLPYYDAGMDLAITSDAIIDNRDELFEKLQIRPADRKEMTDSLLIMLAYKKWGQHAPKHLIGDFAFIIWDRSKSTLFGARDFSGARTLYFAQTDGLIGFCTVIRPLLTLPGMVKELSDQWISEFLAIPITIEAVDLYSTVYKQVGQVPPSHSFTLRNGKLSFERYSTIASENTLKLRSDGEYEEAFRDVYTKAITSRLRTYREVGANLSGGLDSGSVVSIAARELMRENKKLHTFSYVPQDDFQDWTPKSRVANEKVHIKETVKYVGNINDQYFDFPTKNPLSEIDDWLDLMETPYKFYENSFWMKGIYEQAQQLDAGVILTGARGNWSVSWGPVIEYQATLLRQMKLHKFYNELTLYCNNVGINKSRLYKQIGRKAFPTLVGMIAKNPEKSYEPLGLINPHFAEKMKVYEKLDTYGYEIWGQTVQDMEQLRKAQFEKLYYWTITGTVSSKQSLRHSLWERDATNDLRVIRFCLSLPKDQFVQNGFGRSLIRRSTKGYLPDSIRLNQKLRGIQGADGIHRMLPAWNELLSELHQVIKDPAISEYLNIDELTKALAVIEHSPRPDLIYDANFRILMRSLIFRRFIQKHA
ncbi:asparagine synthase [Paenibacillus sp. GSMTC-2017]|uniref:asparagine synthase n=1 Tax=Paenibacillus sp. GSMTC-2017 TaxID=2794350 RepID=UPI0018D97825|nr:asparagine synthase [Paenibacillus sp. GSMTC-2017]MBH5317282.1 asparagine synthase [Paenibacillus sp. GSMTC-2017]